MTGIFNWYDPKPNKEEKLAVEEPPPPPYLLEFFAYSHLPPSLQRVSAPFCVLAHQLAKTPSFNPEMNEALRKLLEAKDCAVRAVLMEADRQKVEVIVRNSGAGGGATQ